MNSSTTLWHLPFYHVPDPSGGIFATCVIVNAYTEAARVENIVAMATEATTALLRGYGASVPWYEPGEEEVPENATRFTLVYDPARNAVVDHYAGWPDTIDWKPKMPPAAASL